VHDQWEDWAYENAIPFHALDAVSFNKACIAIGEYGPSYIPPLLYKYCEALLMKAKQRTKNQFANT